MANQYAYIKKQIKLFQKHKVSLISKAIFYTAIIQVVLYIVLFTEYPGIHDYFHELRHALAIVPCH